MQSIKEKAIYRAELANSKVPLGLRSVGYACFQPMQASSLRKTDFIQILWTLAGEGRVRLQGREYKVPCDWISVCLPQEKHCLSSPEDKSWEYRWCTIDGPLAAVLISSFSIPKIPFHAGPCPSELFEILGASLRNPSPESERLSSVEAYRFIVHVGGRCISAGPGKNKIKIESLISHSAFNPCDKNLNVQTIAEYAGVSRFSVHRLFRDELGITPKHYLDSLRLQKAFSLLRESKMTIEEIAIATGLENANYFAKFFRRKTGFSPSRFRNEHHMP